MPVPDNVSTLAEQLNIRRGEMVGFVGAGGKTTTLLRLLAELRAAGRTVLTTSTVHMFDLKGSAPHQFLVEPDAARLMELLPPLLARSGHVRVASERLRADKIRGLDVTTVDRLKDVPGLDNLLVECDGARHRSLKAPGDHEPVMPSRLDLLLIVLGIDIIGKPLHEDTVHRLESVQALTGLGAGDIIGPQHAAAVLTSRQGGLKAKPSGCRAWVIATRLTAETEQVGETLATEVLSRAGGQIEGVALIGSAPLDLLTQAEVIVRRATGKTLGGA